MDSSEDVNALNQEAQITCHDKPRLKFVVHVCTKPWRDRD